MSILIDVKTHSRSVAHGPDRAPVGWSNNLFAALSGGGADAGKQASRLAVKADSLGSKGPCVSRCYYPNLRVSLLAVGDASSRQSAMDA